MTDQTLSYIKPNNRNNTMEIFLFFNTNSYALIDANKTRNSTIGIIFALLKLIVFYKSKKTKKESKRYVLFKKSKQTYSACNL